MPEEQGELLAKALPVIARAAELMAWGFDDVPPMFGEATAALLDILIQIVGESRGRPVTSDELRMAVAIFGVEVAKNRRPPAAIVHELLLRRMLDMAAQERLASTGPAAADTGDPTS